MAAVAQKKKVVTGKRKCAIARIRLIPGEGKITVNGKEYLDYFGHRLAIKEKILSPFKVTGTEGKYDVKINVVGGGKVGQADAVRHAIAKSLVIISQPYRTALKAAGYISRDSRVKERKKYGRKRARKSFQWTKR